MYIYIHIYTIWTYLGQVLPGPKEIKIKTENRHGLHTSALVLISEISVFGLDFDF